jgi:hypothetical protein
MHEARAWAICMGPSPSLSLTEEILSLAQNMLTHTHLSNCPRGRQHNAIVRQVLGLSSTLEQFLRATCIAKGGWGGGGEVRGGRRRRGQR